MVQSGMPLTPQDKSRVRKHLGYPQVSPASSLQLGIPVATQPYFLLEAALNYVMEDAIPTVLDYLNILDKINAELESAICNLSAQRVGDIELRSGKPGESHPDMLEKEYRRWASRLADLFGVPLYSYSARFSGSTVAGNVRVQH